MGISFTSRQKKAFFLSLLISLLAMGLILFFTTSQETLVSLRRVQPHYLFLALLAVVAAWFLEGLRLHLIIRGLERENPPGIPGTLAPPGSLAPPGTLKTPGIPGILDCVKIFLCSFFFGGITPMALGEWPSLLYYFHRRGVSLGTSTTLLIIRNSLTKGFFLVMGLLLFALYQGRVGGGLAINYFFRLALVLLVLSSLLYFLVLLYPRGIISFFRFLKSLPFLEPMVNSPPSREFILGLRREGKQFQSSMARLGRGRSRKLALPALLTLGYWFTYFLVPPLIMAGLGLEFQYWNLLIWQILIILIMVYAPLPGGSGFVEISLATFFSAHVPSHLLGIFVVTWRFFTYYLYLLVGGFLVTGLSLSGFIQGKKNNIF